MHIPVKTNNPVRELQAFGQSVVVGLYSTQFHHQRSLAASHPRRGSGRRDVKPAIFEKTSPEVRTIPMRCAGSRRAGLDAQARFERLAIEDVQSAADLLQPVYARTKRRDGYVKQVSPHVAHDTPGRSTKRNGCGEAVERDNVMIKVPATPAGISAIEQLIGMGINVNVTLLFSQETYADVAEAYLTGLEQFAKRAVTWGRCECGQFFVSRIDTAADAEISAYLKQSTHEREQGRPTGLLGKLAVANAKLAYQRYQTLFPDLAGKPLRNRGHDPTLFGRVRAPKSSIPRRAVRGRTDRSGDGQHDAVSDTGCVS